MKTIVTLSLTLAAAFTSVNASAYESESDRMKNIEAEAKMNACRGGYDGDRDSCYQNLARGDEYKEYRRRVKKQGGEKAEDLEVTERAYGMEQDE
jgi:predicted outer membrane lipoprotein